MRLHPLLDLELTKLVYLSPEGRCWHLAGPNAGAEGVVLGDSIGGHFDTPVSLLLSKGARQDGVTVLRSVRSEKEIDFNVSIGGDAIPLIFRSARHFHAVHDAWLRDWSTDRPGTWAGFTRHQGWRFQRVQRDGPVVPLTGIDPQLNYHEILQMSVLAADPAMRSFDEMSTWTNVDGLNEGIVVARNAADQPAHPRYTMNGPGRWHIGDPVDGDVSRLVQTPVIAAGETLRIDTHPRHRTARVYSEAAPSGRNVWAQLAGRRWLAPIPPWSSVPIPVAVTDGGTTESSITVTVTPRSSRPY
ncbi:phage tail protein [Nocardia sp. R16R-3T]